jgi:preprotein translocase subunit YajC
MGENFVQVEVADTVTVKVRRAAIESVLPKGSLKDL